MKTLVPAGAGVFFVCSLAGFFLQFRMDFVKG
jgi:hypothetical protein